MAFFNKTLVHAQSRVHLSAMHGAISTPQLSMTRHVYGSVAQYDVKSVRQLFELFWVCFPCMAASMLLSSPAFEEACGIFMDESESKLRDVSLITVTDMGCDTSSPVDEEHMPTCQDRTFRHTCCVGSGAQASRYSAGRNLHLDPIELAE